MSTPTLSSIPGVGSAAIAPVVAGALGRNEALLATDAVVLRVPLDGSARPHILEISFDAAPQRVELSSSQRFLLAVDAQRARVWTDDPHHTIMELSVDGSTTSLGATFGQLYGREVLIHEPRRAWLDAYELPSGTRIFSGSTETFSSAMAAAIGGGAYLALVGYFRGEGKDSMSVVPLEELTQPADVLFARFREKRSISDYAYRLAAGPCGNDALVVFRDPEEDEEPDEDEELVDGGPFEDTPPKADIRRLCGFYVRTLDGALRTRLEWNHPALKSYARISATASWIAVECGDEIALIPLAQAQTAPPLVAARWLAASMDGARVLVETRDGTPKILTLPT